MWRVRKGFLPNICPRAFSGEGAYFSTLEHLSSNLADLLDQRKFREEIVWQLRQINPEFDLESSVVKTERLMLFYSYFASSYVHARGETTAHRIPKEIAVPLVRIASHLRRPPILSYASYCLNNWQKIFPDKPIELGNLRLLQHFCGENSGRRDEAWFILVHVQIEEQAGDVIDALDDFYTSQKSPQNVLKVVLEGLTKMNDTLRRMPEQCDPENYFRWVRPYIFGFDKVVYEGCFQNQPQSFRGETGAQSSIIPALEAAFGITHQSTLLTTHLKDMRSYMPEEHRLFLNVLEKRPNLRSAVGQDKDAYNDCLKEIIEFRKIHFQYARDYIEQRVENPQGTGGTPYVQWLKQLIDETESQLL